MDEHEDRKEFIKQHLNELCDCTTIGIDFISCLFSKSLITNRDSQVLKSEIEYDRAASIYSHISNKWDHTQFSSFIEILKQTSHNKAYEIFTAEGAEVFLTRGHIDILKEQLNKSSEGCYDGTSFEIEQIANDVLKHCLNGNLFVGKKFVISEKLDRWKIIPQIRQFINAIESKTIWWNSFRPQLPKYFIERKIYETKEVYIHAETETKPLTSCVFEDANLILLVDPPGMGKSSALTRLEAYLKSLKQMFIPERIILRINLSRVQDSLNTTKVDKKFTFDTFLVSLADFIPLEELLSNVTREPIPVFILLDGLDEVLPTYEDTMLDILRVLLTSGWTNHGQLYVGKVILTTRPHYRELIENQFQIEGLSLAPLSFKEQMAYLCNYVNTTVKNRMSYARAKLKDLPETARHLMSNPLMLNLYAETLGEHKWGPSKPTINIYELYSLFMEKKHEIFFTEKEGSSLTSQVTKGILKLVLKSNTKHYSFLAVNEILKKSDADKVLSLQPGERPIAEQPSSEDIDGLLGYGIVVKEGNQLKFKHKSFAEFYYVKLTCDCPESSQETRNALFALGYKHGLNIEEFFLCVLENTKLNKIISRDWIRWVPDDAELSRYQSSNGKLLNDILSNLVDYTGSCHLWGRFLIKDFLEHGVFLRWLKEQDEKWLCENIFKASESKIEELRVNQLVASFAILAKLPLDLAEFMKNPITRNSVDKFFSVLQSAKSSNSKDDLMIGYSSDTREKFYKFLLSATCISLGVSCSAEDINYHEEIEMSILEDFEASWFLAETLTRDDILRYFVTPETRISDISGKVIMQILRFWGSDFIPPLLKFRYKYSEQKGKSIFQYGFPVAMEERLWIEIEKNLEEVFLVINDDNNLAILETLECSLVKTEWLHYLRLLKFPAEFSESLPHDLVQKSSRFRAIFCEPLYKVCTNNQLHLSWNHLRICISYSDVNDLKLEKLIAMNGITRQISCLSDMTEAFWCVEMYAIVLNRRKDVISEVEFKQMTKCLFGSAKINDSWEPTVNVILEMKLDNVLDIISSPKECNLLNRYLISAYQGLSRCWHAPEFLHSQHYFSQNPLPALSQVFRNLCIKNLFKIFQNALYCITTPDEVMEYLNVGRKAVNNDILFRSVLLEQSVLNGFASITFSPFNVQQVGQRSILCFAVVVQFYIEMFKDEESRLIWVKEGALLEKIPVQLWSAINQIKQNLENQEDPIFSELTKEFQKVFDVPLKMEINSQFLILQNKFNYRTEHEQARLLECCGHKDAAQYPVGEKIYSHWLCALLRTWIKVFGPEDVKTQSEVIADNTSQNLWSFYRGTMIDGELLHIAVEVKSLIGVRNTAWPGLLRWKNDNGKTARDVSLDLWGPDDEITKFLIERENAAKILHDVRDS